MEKLKDDIVQSELQKAQENEKEVAQQQAGPPAKKRLLFQQGPAQPPESSNEIAGQQNDTSSQKDMFEESLTIETDKEFSEAEISDNESSETETSDLEKSNGSDDGENNEHAEDVAAQVIETQTNSTPQHQESVTSPKMVAKKSRVETFNTPSRDEQV